jgi:hypothetical protein
MTMRSRIAAAAGISMLALGSWASAQTAGQERSPAVDPAKLDFGSHEIGTKAVGTATVSNLTSARLRFKVRPQDLDDYAVVKDGCDADVPPRGTCTIVVGFSPSRAGERVNTLVIQYLGGAAGSAAAKALNLQLSGQGLLPTVGISPLSLAFDPQQLYTQSPPQTVLLTNNSKKDDLTLRVVASGPFFLEAPTQAQTLKPGASIAAVVRFRPRREGWSSGVLTIVSGPPDGKVQDGTIQEVKLSGRTRSLLGAIWTDASSGGAALALVLCFFYWLAMVIVRWHRVATPSRLLLRSQLDSVTAELDTLTAGAACPSAAITELLKKAREVLDGPNGKAGKVSFNLSDFLFWSRGQEMTGWGYAHEAQVMMVPCLSEPTVTARLESAEEKLRLATDAPSLALADSVHRALTSQPAQPMERLRALLCEALYTNYNTEDTNFSNLVSWQNKTSWLVGCGLVLILMLTIAFPDHGILFLIGGAGGLISRLSRSLDRKDVPTDYGASWTTLFLSPVAGALGAWAGILIAALAVSANVLGSALTVDWNRPDSPMTLAVALLFGFSERLLDSVFDKLESKALGGQPAGAPKPPLTITDPGLLSGTANVQGTKQLEVTGATGDVKWSITSPQPPAWLQLTPDLGVLTWTAPGPGDYSFTVEVQDLKSNAKANRQLSLKV